MKRERQAYFYNNRDTSFKGNRKPTMLIADGLTAPHALAHAGLSIIRLCHQRSKQSLPVQRSIIVRISCRGCSANRSPTAIGHCLDRTVRLGTLGERGDLSVS